MDNNHGASMIVLCIFPSHALFAFWTGGNVFIPVNQKLARVVAFCLLCLPTTALFTWADQIHSIVLATINEGITIYIAHIHIMLLGKQMLFSQFLMNRVSQFHIWCCRW